MTMAATPLAPIAAKPRMKAAPWQRTEIVFWLVAVIAPILLPGHLVLVSQILIAGLFAMSLDLLVGYVGIPSLGHAAFFGLGAYTAGLLAKAGFGDPLLGLAAAAMMAAAFGLICSLLLARLGGVALLTVTMGMGLLVYEVANRASDLTGGDDGLQGIEISPVLGAFDFDFYGRTGYCYTLVLVFVCYCLLRRLVQSPFGLSLQAIRENPRRVPALGISVRHQVMAAFTLSAGVAGVAGALLTQTSQFVALEVLSFDRSSAVLIMVIFGGAGTLIGPLIGAAVYMVAHDVLSSINPTYWYFWLGLMLAGIVLVGRGGLMGWIRRMPRLSWRHGGT